VVAKLQRRQTEEINRNIFEEEINRNIFEEEINRNIFEEEIIQKKNTFYLVCSFLYGY
jgi:hypothetical protein